jgi:hypothetical protein
MRGAMQELAARYGVLLKDAGIALRGLFLINPEVPPPGRGLVVAGGCALRACRPPAPLLSRTR